MNCKACLDRGELLTSYAVSLSNLEGLVDRDIVRIVP
jgi:hypothetical protein